MKSTLISSVINAVCSIWALALRVSIGSHWASSTKSKIWSIKRLFLSKIKEVFQKLSICISNSLKFLTNSEYVFEKTPCLWWNPSGTKLVFASFTYTEIPKQKIVDLSSNNVDSSIFYPGKWSFISVKHI